MDDLITPNSDYSGNSAKTWPMDDMIAKWKADNENRVANNIGSLKEVGGVTYDPSSVDSYIDAKNQAAAWQRDDQALSRFVQQAKSVGLNPALLLSNGGASAFATIGNSTKSSSISLNKLRDISKATGVMSSSASMLSAIGNLIGNFSKMLSM